MKVTEYKKTLNENAVVGTRKAYRAAPGNFDAAACYAVHVAKRDAVEVAIIPGSSYGSAVYHIAPMTADLGFYIGGFPAVLGATVTPEGLVRMARLES